VVELDPWLFAIPIPLIVLEANSAATSSTKRKTTSKKLISSTDSTSFDHSFPTPGELNDDNNNARAVAKRFLVRLLKHFKPNKPLPQEAYSRLRDPHLLLHLSDMLDPAAFDLLLAHISPLSSLSSPQTESNKPLSIELAMVMQSVQTALDSDDLSSE